jgi:hypothetical protein
MDPIKIIQRAWNILWNYRTLWVFGLILALATAGSASGRGGNNNIQWREDGSHPQPPPESMQQFFQDLNRSMDKLFREGIPQIDISGRALTSFLWVIGVFIVVMLVVGVFVTIARYVSETAVIRMVDEYEGTGTKMSVRQGFRMGWSRTSWRLFLIDLILSLPVIFLLLILLSAGVGIYLAITRGHATFAAASIVTMIGLIFLSIFLVVILSIVLSLLRQFFWRTCVLENKSVSESFRQGLALVRQNWKNVGLMWLVMIGLGLAWIVVSIIAAVITIPIVILTAIIAAVVVALPVLLLVGIFSTFLSGPLPWIAGALFLLPLFVTIAFSPWLMLGSWQTVFTSTVWTLTYREIKALPAITPTASAQPAGD